MPEEFLVLLRRDLGFWPRPDGIGRIDLFGRFAAVSQHDRMADMIGIGAHHLFDFPALEKFKRIVLEMQDNGGAARPLLRRNHRKRAQRLPRPR